MGFITRHTDYAVKALRAMHGKTDRTSVSDLCKILDMPRPFLRQILQTLSNQGLLESTKGRGGGFKLARSSQKISLYDVMVIFQKEVKLNQCQFKKEPCPNQKSCNLRSKLNQIENELIEKVRGITIASLAEGD